MIQHKVAIHPAAECVNYDIGNALCDDARLESRYETSEGAKDTCRYGESSDLRAESPSECILILQLFTDSSKYDLTLQTEFLESIQYDPL